MITRESTYKSNCMMCKSTCAMCKSTYVMDSN